MKQRTCKFYVEAVRDMPAILAMHPLKNFESLHEAEKYYKAFCLSEAGLELMEEQFQIRIRKVINIETEEILSTTEI